MAASSRLMITEAERRFPARIRIAVPPEGLGRQLDDMTAWLNANCGAGNWAMTPSGLRGIVNDALAIYFLDTALANAFVARWCLGYRAETIEGSFRLHEDPPAPRIPNSAPPDSVGSARRLVGGASAPDGGERSPPSGSASCSRHGADRQRHQP